MNAGVPLFAPSRDWLTPGGYLFGLAQESRVIRISRVRRGVSAGTSITSGARGRTLCHRESQPQSPRSCRRFFRPLGGQRMSKRLMHPHLLEFIEITDTFLRTLWHLMAEEKGLALVGGTSKAMFLELDNLGFDYGEKAVLHNVSFALERSKTLAIVGASGSGKSTLLRILSGILPSARGRISSGQTEIDGISPEDYRKSGKLAFMFQESTLMPNLTVRDNIGFPLSLKGVNDDERVSGLLRTVGLEEHADKLPKQLSGGMKTRVALARSFVTSPELLLLDEPFSALDIAWKSKLYVELEKLKEQNKTTVVLVTHDVQEAILLSDLVVVLSKRGTKIKEESLASDTKIMARLADISNFLGTTEYQNLFVAIQKWIMDDGVRSITGKSEVDSILQKLSLFAGTDNERWDTFGHDMLTLREYSNNAEANRILNQAFRNGKSFLFKYGLIWDLLNYPDLSPETFEDVVTFYLENIQEFSARSATFYCRSEEEILDFLLESRLKNEIYTEQWRALHLCDLYFSSEVGRVISYLSDVERGAVSGLASSFSRKVAAAVRQRIEHEKNYALHTA